MKRYKTLGSFAISILAVICSVNCAIALNWNDPGVIPVQSISDQAWRDGVTGRRINIQGMPQPWLETTSSGSGTGTTGATSATVGTGTTGETGASTSTGATGSATNASTLSKAGKVAGAALGVASGTAMVVNATSGQEEHSWGDVVQGAIGGGIAAASGAAGVNAFVGVGQLAYAITVASGALVGGLVAGSQLFSETDCLYDPITNEFTCCHTQFNQGERYADIGEYMFCSKTQQDGTEAIFKPAVRQCVQGNMNKSDTWTGEKSGWWSGLWKDDFWAPECEIRICDNVLPQSGIDEYIDYTPDTEHFCWNWGCINGYTRSGNTCVKSDGTSVTPKADDYDSLVQKIQAERSRILQECGKYQNSQTTSATK